MNYKELILIQGKIHDLPRDTTLRILQKNGFVIQKSKGPHYKLKKFDENGKCICTVFVSHAPNHIPSHIRNIIRITGKPKEEFY